MTTSYSGAVLARVRALVMERDDSSGGWVPSGLGDLSIVSVVKTETSPAEETSFVDKHGNISLGDNRRTIKNDIEDPEEEEDDDEENEKTRDQYVIVCRTSSEESLVFRSVIGVDFNYHRVMPTFHYWESEGKKFGLIFQTAADGRLFDKGVMNAMMEILGCEELVNAASVDGVPSESDNEVFMAVDLPYKFGENIAAESGISLVQSSSSSSGCVEPKLCFKPNVSLENVGPPTPKKQSTVESKYLESPTSCKNATSSSSSNSLRYSIEGKPENRTRVCKHCRQTYTEEENVKGSCEYARDYVRTTIDTVTCIPCARTMVYHCMSHEDEDFTQPCECETPHKKCSKRWVGVALLSILLPCLWCYPPLKMCHLCGVSCGICGGRHESINPPGSSNSP